MLLLMVHHFLGLLSQLSQTGAAVGDGLKQQKCTLSPSWRSEVQNQGVSRAALPPAPAKTPGEDRSCLSSAVQGVREDSKELQAGKLKELILWLGEIKRAYGFCIDMRP